MSVPPSWLRNRLLLALPSSNLRRLVPELEPIPCERNQILLDADNAIESVFFPHSGVVSVLSVYEDGSVIETATIGREDCTAFQAILGAKESSVRFLVQIPGTASRMSRAAFMRAMKSIPGFRNLCMNMRKPSLSRCWCRGRATAPTASRNGWRVGC